MKWLLITHRQPDGVVSGRSSGVRYNSLLQYKNLPALGWVLLCLAAQVGIWSSARGADWSQLLGGHQDSARALVKSGVNLNERDADGNTALHVAALHADAAALELLANAGVAIDATNKFGATPLIYAAGDPEKVRILLKHRAKPNRHSTRGNTPLIAAAGSPSGLESVRLLLEAGAFVGATNGSGVDALWRASYAGNTPVARLLLRNGASPNTRPYFHQVTGELSPATTPLHNAAYRGESAMIEELLSVGAYLDATEPFLGTAFENAMYANHPGIAALLVRRGINLNLPTPIGQVPAFVWVGYSDVGDSTMAHLLLGRHLATGVENERGETALTWARKRGQNQLVSLLERQGVPDPSHLKEVVIPTNSVPAPGTAAWRGAIHTAVQRSIDALQESSNGFLESGLAKRDNCVSCHQQTLPAVAFGLAGQRGFGIDIAKLHKQINAQIKSWEDGVSLAYELEEPQADSPVNLGWGLYGISAMGHSTDALTDAMVWYLVSIQEPDGSWRCDDFRPPMEDGKIGAVALSLHALKIYPLHGRENEMAVRVRHAGEWLASCTAETPNRLAFQLLGLSWSGVRPDLQRKLARRILSAQQSDGSWAQLPGLPGDAWATGQALVALKTAGAITVTDSAYRRGAAFLLRTQFADGSWFVRSRTWPFQPYFNSGFAHGKDQWVSASGTSWAVLALIPSLEDADAKMSSR